MKNTYMKTMYMKNTYIKNTYMKYSLVLPSTYAALDDPNRYFGQSTTTTAVFDAPELLARGVGIVV